MAYRIWKMIFRCNKYYYNNTDQQNQPHQQKGDQPTMKIDMETKFEIGQEVYVIQKAMSKELCPVCNGRKKIYQLVGKDTITSIKIFNYLLNAGGHHNEPKTVVKYGFKNGNDFTDQKLFATQEEAEARCRELNKETANAD